MFFPTLAGYSATRTEDRSRFIRCMPPGTQMTGTAVAASFCTMPRSRMMIRGRPSICSIVSSHMLTWYAESSEPEKYRTTVGWYSRSQVSTPLSTAAAPGTRRLRRRYGTRTAV